MLNELIHYVVEQISYDLSALLRLSHVATMEAMRITIAHLKNEFIHRKDCTITEIYKLKSQLQSALESRKYNTIYIHTYKLLLYYYYYYYY